MSHRPVAPSDYSDYSDYSDSVPFPASLVRLLQCPEGVRHRTVRAMARLTADLTHGQHTPRLFVPTPSMPVDVRQQVALGVSLATPKADGERCYLAWAADLQVGGHPMGLLWEVYPRARPPRLQPVWDEALRARFRAADGLHTALLDVERGVWGGRVWYLAFDVLACGVTAEQEPAVADWGHQQWGREGLGASTAVQRLALLTGLFGGTAGPRWQHPLGRATPGPDSSAPQVALKPWIDCATADAAYRRAWLADFTTVDGTLRGWRALRTGHAVFHMRVPGLPGHVALPVDGLVLSHPLCPVLTGALKPLVASGQRWKRRIAHEQSQGTKKHHFSPVLKLKPCPTVDVALKAVEGHLRDAGGIGDQWPKNALAAWAAENGAHEKLVGYVRWSAKAPPPLGHIAECVFVDELPPSGAGARARAGARAGAGAGAGTSESPLHEFRFLNLRPDKKRPNHLQVLRSVWEGEQLMRVAPLDQVFDRLTQ